MDPRVIKVPTRYGNMFILRLDDTIGRSLRHYGEWTHDELAVIGQLVKPGMVVADIGANFGTHTLAMARMVGPEGRVVSVEPQPLLFRILSANLLENGCRNVVAINAGVADSEGWIDLPEYNYEIPANFGGISVEDCASELAAIRSTAPIPQLRLDDIQAMRDVGLIKIDVEGMEKAVLAGAETLISRNRPILYVENEQPGEKSEALLRFISDKGYRIYWYNAAKFSKDNFFNNQDNVFGEEVCVNLLCVPADRGYTLESFRPLKTPKEHPRRPGF